MFSYKQLETKYPMVLINVTLVPPEADLDMEYNIKAVSLVGLLWGSNSKRKGKVGWRVSQCSPDRWKGRDTDRETDVRY